ncbi:hypothetical protein V5O48_007138 [Marasmius crinis-equi]|uniref:NAD(P)-binding protein n=1 Tax=Marasmius crinis-equi TaxID=585013 RepID=A0ABR3FHG5_9AGAR
MSVELESGIALVTGAGQGIGRAIALQLAKDGFDVAVNDIPRNLDQLTAVSEEIKALGRSSSVHIADVSIEEQVKAMVENVVKEHKSLDVVSKVEDWDQIFAVNVRGTFLCYKYAGKQMIAQGRGGRIIGAASVLGKYGAPQLAAYTGTKFAIRGITQSAAKEFGPHGITVNAYAPGIIAETSMMNGLANARAKASGGTPQAHMEQLAQGSPIKRNGTTQDIAELVSYLVSKKASFMTGQSLSPDLFNNQMASQLESGIALVTGAGQGIGRAIALQLAKDGFDVAVNDIPRNLDQLTAVSGEIEALGRSSSVHIADVSIEEQVKTMVENVVKEHKGLDVMVANAGIAKVGSIVDSKYFHPELRHPSSHERKSLQPKLKIGMKSLRSTFAEHSCVIRRGGRIVGAASVVSKNGAAQLSAYSATKFAVRGITQSAAKEFGPHGITVNSYAPGIIGTAMMDFLSNEYAQVINGTPEAFMNQMAQSTAVKRNGNPQDIADLVSYLVSKKASFMTGQTVSCNGGTFCD